jgi:hypothetical protein
LLAANRANAQKSTGPRTPQGKNRVGLSALRHGLHFLSALAKSSRALQKFRELHAALYAALLPDKTDEAAIDLLKRTVLQVWAMKQALARWAASPSEREAWFARTGGVCPAPWQLLIQRPGWRVRISVWVRWGRGPGRRRWLETPTSWKERQARLHVVVTVTASLGHPRLHCSRLEEVPEGVAPRAAFKLKPEYVRKQKGNENVIDPSPIATTLSHAGAGLPRPEEVLGKRGATTLAERLAVSRDQVCGLQLPKVDSKMLPLT